MPATVRRLLSGSSAAEPSIPDPRPGVVRRAPTVTFPGFDGLRAIAALTVVVVHTSFPAGFTTSSSLGPYIARAEAGVEVFFLISGFLLYRPFVAARLAGAPAPASGGYLVRRLMRIFPLYWLVLAVTLNTVSDQRIGVHGLTGVIQTALLVQGYRADWAIQGLTQAWTLDIEVAFYLAVPVYAWLLGRRRRTPRAQVRVELAALAAGFLAAKVVHFVLIPRRHGWTSGSNVWLPVWWDLFAMGMALAVISAQYTQLGRQPRWATWPGFGPACWAVAAGFYWLSTWHAGLPLSPIFTPSRGQDMGRHLLYGLFALFLLLPAAFGPPGRGVIGRLLASRVLVFLGSISYGIYLWHTAVIDLVLDHGSWNIFQIPFLPFLALVLTGTLALATGTHYLVEKPCIRASRRWARWVDSRLRRRAALPAALPGVPRVGAPHDTPTVPLRTGSVGWVPHSWAAAEQEPDQSGGAGHR
ncbi:acetyltransferase [Frankia sp. AiPs1]|uniref:acyltransferase family protein n=1 Tax=Frankia sp. AiPa1 TaxID=573492 RepID=UPI00202BA181|nr:acyltransferase [Frankia sp. AiPa1]MCL9762228.1 acyltransferase [Frankia sp. AiPa1]